MGDQIKWVTSKKGNPVNEGKIDGGNELGSTLYVCRAKHKGNVYPGKYVDHVGAVNVDNGYAVFDGVETRLAEWQIATADKNKYKWVKQVGPFNKYNVLATGNVPVEAGFEVINDGYDLRVFYIARGPVDNIGISPGRVSEGSLGSASFGGKEYLCDEYEVLVTPPFWMPKFPFPPSDIPYGMPGLPDFPSGTTSTSS